jgi:hypothetical protein
MHVARNYHDHCHVITVGCVDQWSTGDDDASVDECNGVVVWTP